MRTGRWAFMWKHIKYRVATDCPPLYDAVHAESTNVEEQGCAINIVGIKNPTAGRDDHHTCEAASMCWVPTETQ